MDVVCQCMKVKKVKKGVKEGMVNVFKEREVERRDDGGKRK